MRKVQMICLAAFAFLFANTAFAQESEAKNYDQGFRLGFGINGGIPTDNDYDWSLGGDVRLQYDLSKRTSLTLTTGFTNLFMGKDDLGNDIKDLGFIPAKAGFKAFVWEDQFYVLGEVGAGFAVTNGYDKTTFLWAPGIGYANKYIDLSVRYEDYHDFRTNQVALRVAYGFDL
ncbi:outer membrane beta-barrel protein [Flavobacterium zhairuonense]|uniref:outer membrane beta-barrel protein n=1 Tax=Flavobacterium zhairuonense TaxID=2493631 RepID=UPI0010478795|nr:outer membrane beta-barrel protein [Flavobacterium zhairuonense]KAF2509204.1 outer membrane beta-barrel protein [Flavobacterium zhairuonense]